MRADRYSVRLFLTLACLALLCASAQAASIGGVVYDDRNRNGLFDAGEDPIPGAKVLLLGRNGAVRSRTFSGADGVWLFQNLLDGDYVVSAKPGGAFRNTVPDPTPLPAPIPDFPFGSPRYSSFEGLARLLRGPAQPLHIGLGDSIGYGFNFCGSLFGEDGYFEPTSTRLDGAGGPTLVADKQSIPGHETYDLLIPGVSGDFPFTDNDIFHAIDSGADLVSISIGGNDFLGAEDGGDPAVAAALVIARRNLQEILSSLTSELPRAAIEINTVYDNEEGGNPLHNVWVPIWNQVLREVAWAQERPVRLAEIYPEYAHDVGGVQLGEPGLICDALGLDGIHPTEDGYDVHEQKLWQSVGGVTLAGADRLDIQLGYQRPRSQLPPLQFDDVTGDAINPEDALATDGQGALIPSDNAEFRVEVFLDNPPGSLGLHHALLKVRYRTTGAPIDDYYRFEASLDGTFSPPGSTPTSWNTILPVVGATGNNGSEILAYPDQPGFRTVAAPLYLGAPTSNAGTLDWPDLQTLSVRLVTTAVGAPDGFSVEWDSAWVEIFTTRPGGAAAQAVDLRSAKTTATRLRAALTTETLLERVGSVPRDGAALDTLAERPTAAPALIERLRSGEAPERAQAAQVLGRLGLASEALLASLRHALTDAHVAVRAAAIEALAALDDVASAPAIAELRDEPRLAVPIARALGHLDAEETLDALLALARDRDVSPTARLWATRGLAGSAHRAALPRLLELRDSADQRQRRLAIAGMRRGSLTTDQR